MVMSFAGDGEQGTPILSTLPLNSLRQPYETEYHYHHHPQPTEGKLRLEN